MKKYLKPALLASAMLAVVGNASAEPVLLSAEWGKAACDAWNADPVLTDELAASGWVQNDGGKGYKVMQLYRTDCSNSSTTELRIGLQDGKAKCIYGGAVETGELNGDADYSMHAETSRWMEMGAGEYGPMKAMMFGRLKFAGPKWEAMKNMDPFTNFLMLTGTVASDATTCPL
ncbi:MAG: SCP2 sterol-binding domain-containing protein [Pseudomonadota bacterium]|nr:SCP2 sterol-binding domain-containing protein [Pseudomonadota bacterium]